MNLMQEARVCYINGQFLATMICATSAIEHLLVVELQERTVLSGKQTLGLLIKASNTKQLLPPVVIERLETLAERRNPVVHRRDPDDESTLASRYLKNKVHPDILFEADAKFSLEVMYEVFVHFLRRSA